MGGPLGIAQSLDDFGANIQFGKDSDLGYELELIRLMGQMGLEPPLEVGRQPVDCFILETHPLDPLDKNLRDAALDPLGKNLRVVDGCNSRDSKLCCLACCMTRDAMGV